MVDNSQNLDKRCINSIRLLAVDAIQKAGSGHPGLPMGAAPTAFVLWNSAMKYNPSNPAWFNRDRFILSAGHGSTLQYAMLYLTGYESPTLEDIKNFRQWNSPTPGHPENTVTPGVEVTTGPLGQGFANAVGMAMAEAHVAARFNKPDCKLIDHFTYSLVGDGCIMEGVTSEAASLAGHLGLGKLIVLYDDNKITIDGSTEITFTEDVTKRFEAYGWQVLKVGDGDNDLAAIEAALIAAKKETNKPTLIKIHTTIGYGSPDKAGTASCHGAPLGEKEVAATRAALKWSHGPFEIPDDVKNHMALAKERGKDSEAAWNNLRDEYKSKYADDYTAFTQMISGKLPQKWESALPSYTPDDKKDATRSFSGKCLNALADPLPGLIGGSADLAASNKTAIKKSGDFQRNAYQNRNINFGIREQAMGSISNGLILHGSGLIPYCATFMVFADYMRNAIRMSAISKAAVIYIMTHDSVAVGEDGPTHQPIEHVAALRAIPDLTVLRPADGNETSGAYMAAIKDRTNPSLLALSRQGVPNLPGTSAQKVKHGAYIISDCKTTPELIIIGTGAELSLCLSAADTLAKDGVNVRVVSMPSTDLFDKQSDEYKNSVLPQTVTRRLIVEAGTSFGWHRYSGCKGDIIGIDHFGTSAPGNVCLEKAGYTVENVIARAKALLK